VAGGKWSKSDNVVNSGCKRGTVCTDNDNSIRLLHHELNLRNSAVESYVKKSIKYGCKG